LIPTASAGIDVGGTKCLGVALTPDGRILAERRRPTPPGGDALVETLVDIAGELAADVGGLGALGAGVPGLVDHAGTLRVAPNLPGVTTLEVGARLRERLDIPVVVDNDATCATWGEYRAGASRGVDDCVLVTLGTGIGGGIVTNGTIERGANGFAGEVGHMVVDRDGMPCVCGRRGCWERYASGSGLGQLGRDAGLGMRAPVVVELAGGDPEAVRGEHVTAAAREGDPAALAIVAEFGWWVALGISNLVTILDPEMVVVGGGLVEAGDLLLAPVRRAYVDLVMAHEHRPAVAIVAAALGEHAGAIGAALLAAEDAGMVGAT
jgi:glucokinase